MGGLILNTFLTLDSDSEDCLPFLYEKRDRVLDELEALERQREEKKDDLYFIEKFIKEREKFQGRASESN